MSQYDIGPKIGIEGEAQFRKALNDINTNLKTLGTEMMATVSAFDKGDKSEEALAAQNQVLNKQIDAQKQKLAELQKGLALATDKYGENDKVTQGWQQSVNKATADLNNMERELEDNKKAVSGFGEEIKKADKQTTDFDGATKSLKESVAQSAKNIAIGVAAIGTAIVGAAAGIFKLALDASETGDKFQKLADVTGFTAEALQEFDYIGNNLGVDLETITGAQSKLIKSMEAAKKPTSAQAEIFKKLGVTTKLANGELVDSQEVFGETINALGNVANETERDSMAMQLFGKSAMALNPLIAAGSDELNRLGEEARNSGAVLSNEAISDLDAFGDSVENLKASAKGMMGQVAAALLPVLNTLVEKAKEFDPQKIIDAMKWVLANAGNIAAGAAAIGAAMLTWNVVSIVTNVVKAIQAFKEALNAAKLAQMGLNLAMKANVIGIIITAVAALVAGLIVLWNTNEGFRNAVIGAWEAIKTAAESVWGAIATFFTETIPAVINSIVTWFSELPGKIGQAFTDVLTAITAWGANAAAWVANAIPQLIENIGTFFSELPGKIGYALGLALGTLVRWGVDGAKWIVTEVPKLIASIIEFFSELPGKIAEVLTRALQAVIKWITDTAAKVKTEVPKIISSVITFFSELPGKIASLLSNALQAVAGWFSSLVSTVRAEAPKVVSNIVSFFSALPGNLKDIGINLVKGLWEGITSLGSWLKSKISDFAGGIIRGFKDGFKESSPSKIMRDEIGKNLVTGLAQGITGMNSWMQKSISNFTAGVVDGFKTGFDISSPSETMRDMAEGIADSARQISAAMQGLDSLIAGGSMGIGGPALAGAAQSFSGNTEQQAYENRQLQPVEVTLTLDSTVVDRRLIYLERDKSRGRGR